MRLLNGLNKKQKEEIRKIVKSEIKKELRKNSRSDIKIKEEVLEAVYTVLNEKNDDLVKSLLEIRNKMDKEETEKSSFAATMKRLLYGCCCFAWVILAVFIGVTVYLCFTNGSSLGKIYSMTVLFILYILLATVIFIFQKSINCMNKNDSYNSFMFIITIIAFIITVFSTLK